MPSRKPYARDFKVEAVKLVTERGLPRNIETDAKTDPLDAQLLLQFAIERQPTPWTPPPDVYHELRQRLVARDALLEMRQQARNDQHALLQ